MPIYPVCREFGLLTIKRDKNSQQARGRPRKTIKFSQKISRANLKSEVSVCLRLLGVPPRPPKRVSSWRSFCGRITVILGLTWCKAQPWCQGNWPWCQGTILECLVLHPEPPGQASFQVLGIHWSALCLVVSPVMFVFLLM